LALALAASGAVNKHDHGYTTAEEASKKPQPCHIPTYFPELVAGNFAGTFNNGKNHFKQTFLIFVLLESIHLID
jgi:hypothetical protein